jgi:hypothetical protein
MTPLAGRVARWGQKVALGLALVMALPLSLAAAQSASDERPEPGHLAPDFDLADLSGERVRLSDLRGKKAVIRSREVAARDWSKPDAWTAIEELLRRGAKK